MLIPWKYDNFEPSRKTDLAAPKQEPLALPVTICVLIATPNSRCSKSDERLPRPCRTVLLDAIHEVTLHTGMSQDEINRTILATFLLQNKEHRSARRGTSSVRIEIGWKVVLSNMVTGDDDESMRQAVREEIKDWSLQEYEGDEFEAHSAEGVLRSMCIYTGSDILVVYMHKEGRSILGPETR